MSHAPAVGMPGVPRLVPILNPLIKRFLRVGLPFGPNVLMTVRGRSSGQPHTFPVAILELGGRRYVQSPFGEVNWVRNLRAAGEAVVTKGRDQEEVEAIEVPPDAAGRLLHDALAPFVRSMLSRPLVRWLFGLGRESTLEDYVEGARRHPMFELRARRAGG